VIPFVDEIVTNYTGLPYKDLIIVDRLKYKSYWSFDLSAIEDRKWSFYVLDQG